MNVIDHPLVHDINTEHCERLSAIERICKRIADGTGAPIALVLAICIQATWIAVGMITKWDPFPFAFLLTVSNVVQLILIFVLAVGQRQSFQHSELRAEHDHDAISRLFYHQEVQEELLFRLALKLDLDIADLKATVLNLATQTKSTSRP